MVLVRPLGCALWALLCLGVPGEATASAVEDERRYSGVGRLLVPAVRYENGYARHYDERCSGTVVTLSDGAAPSSYIISAWHCLEDYRDLSRPLIFETVHGDRSEVRLVASGGTMDQDWALLRLTQAMDTALPVTRDPATPTAVIMVGFPRDRADGAQTVVHCAIAGLDGSDYRGSCALQQGASGGGVFSIGESPRYLGVISRGDGVSQSIFVPVGRFLPKLRSHF